MFSVADRDRARALVLELAAADPRVVAGALVGSLANGGGDRWSDLDLAFGVVDATPRAVLDDWTPALRDALGASPLFDLPADPVLYRVFLLPGALQVDLSCMPAAVFGPGSPTWELLFGEQVERPLPPARSAAETFGLAVHHAVRVRVCVERGRVWQAEHWLGELRDETLALACIRLGLPARHARGLDDLPLDVLSPLADARPRTLARAELLRALRVAIAGLLREAGELGDPLADVLRALA